MSHVSPCHTHQCTSQSVYIRHVHASITKIHCSLEYGLLIFFFLCPSHQYYLSSTQLCTVHPNFSFWPSHQNHCCYLLLLEHVTGIFQTSVFSILITTFWKECLLFFPLFLVLVETHFRSFYLGVYMKVTDPKTWLTCCIIEFCTAWEFVNPVAANHDHFLH